MIVRHHTDGWKIISHYTHGLLAGKFAYQLNQELRHTHWVETLAAITDHDDYMVDFDATNYLTNVGTPRDFMMEGGYEKDAIAHAKKLYKESKQKSGWIVLLIARHLQFLYGNDTNKEMKHFLAEIYEKSKVQRKLYGINKKIEDDLYYILLFCDRLSLIICGEEVPKTGRKLEINTSIEDKTYHINRNEDGTFLVTPWIFEADCFEVDFEYKIVNQVNFESNKELEDVLELTAVHLQKVTFRNSK
ncbi:hypothetical protein Celal_3232 [Cellulophaga algicola DSM 14237]|uniref:DUF3891 domain-containing protein n=1 Tax=Cellulophaga algicola (strain DSM 14237 / IC166 / ACAM 630) TaxID=688270 RepID=E6X5E8_CELAD|nr:DUF3891 family protein [Cellulophaga algicola]ADV50503.1 hypothetical protein Celal_3232 [Cellulophaga algicola DSM 14237]